MKPADCWLLPNIVNFSLWMCAMSLSPPPGRAQLYNQLHGMYIYEGVRWYKQYSLLWLLFDVSTFFQFIRKRRTCVLCRFIVSESFNKQSSHHLQLLEWCLCRFHFVCFFFCIIFYIIATTLHLKASRCNRMVLD